MSKSMRPLLVIGLVVLGVGAVVGVSEWRTARVHEVIAWRTDFTAAQAEAKAQHKPLFVYFSAVWCGNCEAMKATTWADNNVKQAMEKYVPVKIDVDEKRALAERFAVRGMPTYVVLSEGGEEVRRGEGGVFAKQMIEWLNR